MPMQSSTSQSILRKAAVNSCRLQVAADYAIAGRVPRSALTHVRAPRASVRSRGYDRPSLLAQYFSTAPLLQKKKQKDHSSHGKGHSKQRDEDPEDDVIPPEKVVEDAFDFTELEEGVKRNVEKLKAGLSTLRPGGRLDPEVIEGFRVTFKGHSGTERLGDLATVIRKGGTGISVIVAEEENLKAISDAIATSPHSLVPSPDPENPLILNFPIPPPTAESRNAVKQTAKDMMETANHAIRQVRGDYQKKLRKLELDKKSKVPKDDMARAHKELEKRNEAAVKEVKKIYEDRIKALDR